MRRTAGARWRLQVHGNIGDDGMANTSQEVTSDPGVTARRAAMTAKHPSIYAGQLLPIVLDGFEFDELVVGRWLHVEEMDTGCWWGSIGGVVIHVRVDRDGRPKLVSVNMPGTSEDPVEGCEYMLDDEAYPTKET